MVGWEGARVCGLEDQQRRAVASSEAGHSALTCHLAVPATTAHPERRILPTTRRALAAAPDSPRRMA